MERGETPATADNTEQMQKQLLETLKIGMKDLTEGFDSVCSTAKIRDGEVFLERSFKDVESRVHTKRMKAAVENLIMLAEDLAQLRMSSDPFEINREYADVEHRVGQASNDTNNVLIQLKSEGKALDSRIADHFAKYLQSSW
mmetsp:Transcript_4257/g.8458  ORF Transcript_4257/g.8458 Transcript_4257/m.8458 type:complete len:142 (-) Transcript_4257:3217-3642(-)|eukprot:CAMPEP_0113909148 /NCGR_PEP_ID=MMETSP0780_2-20120614/26638_1 /TAXON_ID=652834 /ORGANISM="Palpitomonas bilix" /LENGTH=141 /DNA_ID=CAMNT_0000904819 /DNA_START=251 /DNA_END=676 /DNA_ORIENTATION=+ /assembly_acc=CAM_ASM_000599